MILRVDGLATGGQPDFVEFYESRVARAIRLAHLLTGSRAVGEDIAHDAFESMHRKWATISTPDAYPRSTIVNLSRTVQRRQIRERLHVDRMCEAVTAIPALDETWAMVRRLPVDQRVVVVLRFRRDGDARSTDNRR